MSISATASPASPRTAPATTAPAARPRAREVAPHEPRVVLTADDVHKHRPDALLLRSWQRTGEHAARLTARWAPGHPFYRCTPGDALDAMLVLETLRQSFVASAHHLLGVSRDSAFVMNSIEIDVAPHATTARGGSVVTIELECSDVVVRDGLVRSVRAELIFLCHDEVVARGRGDLVLLSSDSYRRLRGDVTPVRHRSPLPRVPARTAGRRHDSDVVISSLDERAWRLAVDTDHVHLFDHLYDHVPGMVILEAAQQAYGSIHPGRPLRSLRATFRRYAEYTSDIVLQAMPRSSASGQADGIVRLDVVQAGDSIATIDVLVAP